MAIKEERERERQQAIEHNNAQRELLTRQAADGRKLHPSLIAKQATRYRAAVQQADNAAQAAARAEKRAAEAEKRAEAREGQAQALDKLLEAKKAELERLDRTIEQRRGHGRDGPSFGPR